MRSSISHANAIGQDRLGSKFGLFVLLALALALPEWTYAQGRGNGGGSNPPPPPIQFSLEVLTTSSGASSLAGGNTTAHNVNSQGDVVGSSSGRAFLWTSSTQMIDLNSLLSSNDQANWQLQSASGINDAGQVCGQAVRLADGALRAFRLNVVDGSFVDLGPHASLQSSDSHGINDSGDVAGYSHQASGYSEATVWLTSFPAGALGMLSGQTFADAFSINNSLTLCGGAATSQGMRAVVWSNPSAPPIVLGYFAAGADGKGWSFAYDLNDNGQVVGQSSAGTTGKGSNKSTVYRAFRWKSGQSLTNLGTLGGASSRGNGINSLGEVVGVSDLSGGGTAAFLYTDSWGLVNVNQATINKPSDLQWMAAIALNDDREILVRIAVGGNNGPTEMRAGILRPLQ